MAADVQTRIARRLLVLATAAMPSSRRDWGRAMSAELACARSRSEQARLVVGAMRVTLLAPRGLADHGRSAARSAGLAAIAFVPLGLGLYLANVIFPSAQDGTTAGVVGMDAYLFLALMTVGALARRASARLSAPVIAGIAAGLVVAALSMVTFAVIDNAFLAIVSHQQSKIDGFRASGMTSMRGYINADLESTAPGVALFFTVVGAVLASIGAALTTDPNITWLRLHLLPRR
jgi:hypothetical protein